MGMTPVFDAAVVAWWCFSWLSASYRGREKSRPLGSMTGASVPQNTWGELQRAHGLLLATLGVLHTGKQEMGDTRVLA